MADTISPAELGVPRTDTSVQSKTNNWLKAFGRGVEKGQKNSKAEKASKETPSTAPTGLDNLINQYKKENPSASVALEKLRGEYSEMVAADSRLDQETKELVLGLLNDGNADMLYKMALEYQDFARRRGPIGGEINNQEWVTKWKEMGSHNGLLKVVLPQLMRREASSFKNPRFIENTPVGRLAHAVRDQVTVISKMPQSVRESLSKPEVSPFTGTIEDVARNAVAAKV